jgi:hypothetical protein
MFDTCKVPCARAVEYIDEYTGASPGIELEARQFAGPLAAAI